MKKSLLVLNILLFVCTLNAQELPEKGQKKLQKALDTYKEGNREKSEKILIELKNDYPFSPEVWEYLVKVQYNDYYDKKRYDSKNGSKFSITVTDENGKEKKSDTLADALAKLLEESSPSGMAFKKVIATCREATMKCPVAEYPSMLLRMLKIDKEINDVIKPTAKAYFDTAEYHFTSKNFNKASGYYLKAINEDSSYYKAKLYLGDSYYAIKQYDKAIPYFRQAAQTKPDQQEPWKYLTDALNESKAYEAAVKACINGIYLYPDVGMFFKLEKAFEGLGKKYNKHWIERKVSPAVTEVAVAKTNDPDWKNYLAALKEISPFCDKRGKISSTNSFTKLPYAELYAWEKMLDKTKNPNFEFAKSMRDKGMLDCYVFLSVYHYDIHDQYLSFVKGNKERINEYLNSLAE